MGRLKPSAAGAVLVLVLAGCGFHLRGAALLPAGVDSMNVTYSDPYGVGDPVLVRTARQRLRERGKLGEAGAPATLAIRSVRDTRHITAVAPVRGNSAVYSVTTSVMFSYSVRGATQIANQQLSISNEYSANETQRLASKTERRNLYEAMQRDLVEEIFLRIDALNHDLGAQQTATAAGHE